ncbi:MAG TPA: thioredoxin-dependent thiol peroxidase [Bacteroidales bacterium]|mgnify:FL=1|nr:thioredoxin-dependent thiol peroxidase [Bacteroidales bacterium]
MSTLKKGSKAPDFEAVDQNGNPVSLKKFTGKKVILYFYPKDDTPGCTAEACNLRDNYHTLTSKGFAVIGVSTDPVTSHRKFAEKYELPFTLVSDTEKKIVKAYGVWGEKKMYGKTYEGIKRTTFVIGEDGTIELILDKVDTKDHARQVLEALGTH